MGSPTAQPRLQFGRFEFDVASGELYLWGQRVRLQEQPRQVLAALLERPGEIATREELRDRLWKTHTFVDFEHGLKTAIKKVRQALGDSAEAPEFIETLARRGYRFIAPVGPLQTVPLVAETAVAEAAAAPVTPLVARPKPRWDQRHIVRYLGLALYYTGDVAGARAMLASAARGGKPDVRSQASLASIEAAAGLRDQARARAAKVARGPYMDHHVAYSLGAAYAQLGQADESIVWLQRAADTGFPCYPWFERDSLLEPMQQHPGFVRLLGNLREAFEKQRVVAEGDAQGHLLGLK